MRIALLTDVHANREALSACLAHAKRSGADQYAFLGDFVGYGADPCWVLDTVMHFVEHGAIAVLGNHDAAVVHGPSGTMNPHARHVIHWTRLQLATRHMKFLTGLPLRLEDGNRLFVHANAWAPEGWDYVLSASDAKRSMLATDCRYTFCGHVHEPALYHTNGRVSAFTPVAGTPIPVGPRRRWLVIPGSVGQPRDGIPAACYALFDATRNMLTYFRVPYDFESAARKIRSAGLPEQFVVLLERGR